MFLGTHMHSNKIERSSSRTATTKMKFIISQQDSVVTRLSKTAAPVIFKALTKILLMTMLKKQTNFVTYKELLPTT